MRGKAIALAAGLGLAAGAAAADGFTIHDFGYVESRDLCMQWAQEVLIEYLNSRGGFEVNQTEWVVYGWDLTPGDQDVAIMCPALPNGGYNAFMVVYGEGDNEKERTATANALDSLWFN